MENIRVRFAPSPTGYLHVGGARTALFNWLIARKTNGAFILRIEDTDAQRSSEEMIQKILTGLTWLGLDWDEGPYFQSERLNLYRQAIKDLLDSEKAYPCFCSPDTLAEKRSQSPSGAWLYDGTCRNLSPEVARQRMDNGEQYAIRLKLPPGETTFDDIVRGSVTVQHQILDDFIIQRTSGMPIYHLACVVDDVDLRITHVIRGDDHLSNTPKQILLYQALGKAIPQFAHVPLIMGTDKKRLSKRHGATAVGEYKVLGFLPEALTNFLALLGWSPETDDELFSRSELTGAFSLEAVNKRSAVFDNRKLEWFNGQYILKMAGDTFFDEFITRLTQNEMITPDILDQKKEWLLQLAHLIKPRLKKLDEIPQMVHYFFSGDFEYDEKAVKKFWKGDADSRLSLALSRMKPLDSWTEVSIEDCIRDLAEKQGFSAAKLIHPIRVAITGSSSSPGLFEVMVLLGKGTVLSRLKRAIEWVNRM